MAAPIEPASDKLITNPAAPTTPRGHTFHVHVKSGEVANRVLVVGDQTRAGRIAHLFDGGAPSPMTSDRGYITYTGTFGGVGVTVCAHLIGFPNLDIVLHELRFVCAGPMAVIRLGTCGGLGSTAPGTLSVPGGGAVLVRLEPDYRGPAPPPDAPGGLPSAALPYSLSQLVLPDARLSELLSARVAAVIREGLGEAWPVALGGVHGTGDSFFSSQVRLRGCCGGGGANYPSCCLLHPQGRPSAAFDERNEGLIAAIAARVPGLATLEMETFHLFELARATAAPSVDPRLRIYAAAAHMVIVNREPGGGSVQAGDVPRLETLGGRAALEALTTFTF